MGTSGKKKTLSERVADMKEKYGDIVSDAINLAKINWAWLSTVTYTAPQGHKWLKFGLFEWDDDKKSYQNIVWGDFILEKDKASNAGGGK